MIKLEQTEVVGWESAIRGMRNPLESWDRSDSDCINDYPRFEGPFVPYLGKNDLSLMMKLCNAGTDHRKFMRMIVVYVDITAPIYWVAELDTYKVATVRNSCSFMHKGASRTYTADDFSWHGLELDDPDYVNAVLKKINFLKDKYVETKDPCVFQQLRDVVPQGQNIKFTYMCNYETLANIYKSRKNHRLSEWHDFCDWIEQLPYSELITGNTDNKTTGLSSSNVYVEQRSSITHKDIERWFALIKKADTRVNSYEVGYDDNGNIDIINLYDTNNAAIWAFDLRRITLSDILYFVTEWANRKEAQERASRYIQGIK